MKKGMYKWMGMLFGLFLWTAAVSSCMDDDDAYSLDKFAVEVMTVVPDGDVYYLRRDNGEKLWPFASAHPEYQAEKTRAIVNYTMLSDSIPGFDHGIKVNWIDNILTKAIAPYEGARNDSIYGTDPVAMEAIAIGDGYLNIRFGANYGGQEAHYINLIPVAENDSLPYTLEFRRNAFNDPAHYAASSIVAFDLSTLPSTEGKEVDLVIRTKTFEGEQTYTLKYNSDTHRVSSEPIKMDLPDNLENLR